jgi:hypothetical protein
MQYNKTEFSSVQSIILCRKILKHITYLQYFVRKPLR